MSVKTRHPKYEKYAAKWRRVRDVLAGQDAVYAGGILYLARLKDEEPEDYKARLERTTFFNASWRTIAGFLGMMFRKPPEIDAPEKIKDYLVDVTMGGVTFDMFCEQVALEYLAIDFCGVLTDHPPMIDLGGRAMTVAQAEQYGLRPTMQLYKAENIINWKHKSINNKHMLCMVVLEECHKLPGDSEFEEKEETRYRVLDLDENNLYRQRVFRIDEFGKDELVEGPLQPVLNGKPLDYIPFEADFNFEDPPFIDLIDLNLKHFKVSADYEHGCHFTGLPTPVVTGYQDQTEPGQPKEKLYIGSSSAWVFPDAAAKAFFLEFTGQGLSELRENLKEKKLEMAALGAKALGTEKSGVEAYKTQAGRNVGETSILASISIATSLKLEKSLQTFSAWGGGGETEVKFELNREFLPVVMDAPTLTALIAAWQAGAISEGELFSNLQRGDVIDGDKTLEEHQAEIDAMPPPAPVALAAPGRLGKPTQEEQADLDAEAARKMPKPPAKAK